MNLEHQFWDTMIINLRYVYKRKNQKLISIFPQVTAVIDGTSISFGTKHSAS